ncbi:hypothetical protein [Mycoplasma sp. 'Moose RK']|uniref:hypothetical protein n=1 Tax=Mycoplasma sp. 'Moose RK' TaxID=2780095 RepID=UPI001E35FBB8|nr:hypothetical protein [Mycoplasma sp. 'Moose RK']
MFLVPVLTMACVVKKEPEILLQNLQSKSVEIILDNVNLAPGENVAKSFLVELKKENTKEYQATNFTARKTLHNNEPKILLKISDLDADTRYVIRINRFKGEKKEQLFVKGNVFKTNPNPIIIPKSFQVIIPSDPSSQFSFKVALANQNLSQQKIDVHFYKANETRENVEIQQFTHNLKSDQFLYVNLTNLERGTNYVISGLFDQSGNLLTFDDNLFPYNFRTEADIVGLELSNQKFAGQIDGKLESISVDFVVRFSPGIVNANNVKNYVLVFKRENEGVGTGFDQVDNKDLEFIAKFSKNQDPKSNSYIFRVKFPWNQPNNFYKITKGYNKLAQNNHSFDQNILDSPNILKINPSILQQKFRIDS